MTTDRVAGSLYTVMRAPGKSRGFLYSWPQGYVAREEEPCIQGYIPINPPCVCLMLLPRCYDVCEEKQYLQDLLI